MTLQLVKHNDPILKTKLDLFAFDGDVDALQTGIDIAIVLDQHRAIGLAANQVGLKHRVFVLNTDVPTVMYNPRIVDTSSEQILMDEACLSFPGLMLKVKRPRKIKMRFCEPSGEVFTKEFDGMTARVIQHETDHVNGIVFTDRVSKLVLTRAIEKAKKVGFFYKLADFS